MQGHRKSKTKQKSLIKKAKGNGSQLSLISSQLSLDSQKIEQNQL